MHPPDWKAGDGEDPRHRGLYPHPLIARVHATSMSSCTVASMPVSGARPPAVRARLWLRGEWLGERETQPLLWLHLSDGRVLAFSLPETSDGDDTLIDELLAQVADDHRGTLLQIDCGRRRAIALYAAPVAPMPRLSWGDPRHGVARDFAAGLDQTVLRLLASLNQHRQWDSLRNYNRIAALAPELRARRLQALTRFPLLVAPILLSAHHHLQVHGGKRHAWREHDAAVIEAIEQGRDLTGALARHYGISKGLVRSPICERMWGATGLSHRRLLHLLDGIPAHRRPTQPDDFEQALPLFITLNLLSDDSTDLRRIGSSALASGLESVCRPLYERFAPLGPALADCRDFARAALDWAQLHTTCPLGLTSERLQLAWIEARGFRSLLAASRRWHHHRIDGHDEGRSQERLDNTPLPTVLGEYGEGDILGRELCTHGDLIHEGEAMHHCVASYWSACRDRGSRIFALGCRQDRATAEYGFDRARVLFALEQLRGPCNAEPSQVMARFARAIERELNRPENAPARAMVLQQLKAVRPASIPPFRQPAWLDPTSARELTAVLARLQPACAEPNALLRAFVAGYQYHAGMHLEAQLQPGDALELAPEPDNPHDPLAVAIVWRGERLGYVPRGVNAEIATRLDAGQRLHCELTRIGQSAEPWARVEFVIREENDVDDPLAARCALAR